MRSPARVLSERFVRLLTQRRRRYQRFVYNEPEKLKATIRPGDVLLVDGDQRVSQAIKYLTMSSWSHSALYVGDALLARNASMRADVQRRFGREARHLVVEALVDKGVVVSPLVKYIDLNIRICRPAGLTAADLATVLDHVIARIGFQYDRRNFWDLTRYLLPFQMIPSELREDALHFGSGRDTETICSSLLAEAFGRVRFPILPLCRAPQAAHRPRAPAPADPGPADAPGLQRPAARAAPDALRPAGFRPVALLRDRQVQRAGDRRVRLPEAGVGGEV